MGERAEERWTADEFLRWAVRQPDRWELVHGRPVKMMGGARSGHNRATHNISRVLGNQMLNGPCEVFSSDMAVRVSTDQIRYPDVLVACGRQDDGKLEADDVRMVVEVFSDSTQPFDATDKLAEYRGVETLRYILLAETRRRAVELHSRSAADEEWSACRYEGDEVLELPLIEATLAMDDIYRGMAPIPVLTVLKP